MLKITRPRRDVDTAQRFLAGFFAAGLAAGRGLPGFFAGGAGLALAGVNFAGEALVAGLATGFSGAFVAGFAVVPDLVSARAALPAAGFW